MMIRPPTCTPELLHTPTMSAGRSLHVLLHPIPHQAFVCASAGCPKASTPTSAYRFRSQYGEDMYAHEVPQSLRSPSSPTTASMPVSLAPERSRAHCPATSARPTGQSPVAGRACLTRTLTVTLCCFFTGTIGVLLQTATTPPPPPPPPPLWSTVLHGPAPHRPAGGGFPALQPAVAGLSSE